MPAQPWVARRFVPIGGPPWPARLPGMDWRQAIIDHPALAMLIVLPMVGVGALVKLGMVWITGLDGPADPDALS